MTVTPGFAVWKAAIQVSWATFADEAPLPESVPSSVEAGAEPEDDVEPSLPLVAGGVPSLAAQADSSRAAVMPSAAVRRIFIRGITFRSVNASTPGGLCRCSGFVWDAMPGK